jgi:pimeloyl-ACP methyl ester carboxylesterase
VAVDLAGHGASGLEREHWTIDAFGADVAAVVTELDLDRVILVGHSMGGDAILEAARRLPGRVQGLIWVDVYKRLGRGRTTEQVRAFMAPFQADFTGAASVFIRGMFPPGADPALVEWVVTDMSSAPRVVALAAMESAVTFDREVPAALRELNLPVIAINPEAPPTDSESLNRHGVRVRLMSGVGHFPMLEDPVRFNQLLTTTVEEFMR